MQYEEKAPLMDGPTQEQIQNKVLDKPLGLQCLRWIKTWGTATMNFIFKSHIIMSEYQEMELYSWNEQLIEGKLHLSNIFIPFPAVHASPVIV